jgi:hypothetical protein
VLVEVAVDAPAPARLHAAPRLSRFAPSSSPPAACAHCSPTLH